MELHYEDIKRLDTGIKKPAEAGFLIIGPYYSGASRLPTDLG